MTNAPRPRRSTSIEWSLVSDATLSSMSLRTSRAKPEANLSSELEDRVFTADLRPLLAPDVDWDLRRAARLMLDEIAPSLPGDPWRGGGS